jgi:hypothetical protein
MKKMMNQKHLNSTIFSLSSSHPGDTSWLTSFQFWNHRLARTKHPRTHQQSFWAAMIQTTIWSSAQPSEKSKCTSIA